MPYQKIEASEIEAGDVIGKSMRACVWAVDEVEHLSVSVRLWCRGLPGTPQEGRRPVFRPGLSATFYREG